MSLTTSHQLDEICIDGRELTINELVLAARSPGMQMFTLADDARQRIEASNDLKHELIRSGRPIYGVTAGFGDSNTRQVSQHKTAQLQDNLIRFLSTGVGPYATLEVARATMVVRANCLARGASGVRPEVIQSIVDCLNAGILPRIPERGSVGASGDLVPLSYLAAMLTGQGTVTHHGVVKPAADALRECGLQPLTLEAKEGLALVNGTSFSSAYAALAVHDAQRVAEVAECCTAMASQVLAGNPAHFAEFLFLQKPHGGLMASARAIREMLSSAVPVSEPALHPDVNFRELEQPIQDRYSIRCAPHVIGVVRDTVGWAHDWLTVEVNSSNDNPLFDVTSRTVHNGGNFYGGHVAQAMDSIKTALASVGDLLDRQLELIVDEKFNNGLTPNLIPRLTHDNFEAGLFHGFKGMQITASALAAEALKWTMPATSFSRSTEAHNQDKVSMSTIAARDARSVVELVQQIAAIQLIALCQAADLRGLDCLSRPTLAVYEQIRAVSPFLDRDRALDEDIERVTTLIKSGVLTIDPMA